MSISQFVSLLIHFRTIWVHYSWYVYFRYSSKKLA